MPVLEQIKSLQETSNNNSLQSEDGSKSIHGSSHENLEANEDTEIDNIPRLIQRISYQGYMLEYLDLMEKRMVDLSQSSSSMSYKKRQLNHDCELCKILQIDFLAVHIPGT